MTSLIGQSLGRYHILEQLGEGGMATVYKAYDTHLERHVAIKVILTQKQHTERFLKRFKREARALAQLTHPNIVGIIDYGEYEGMPYLVMEYLPSGTLKQRLGKPIPYQEAAKMLAPIARALAYAHEQKIIHRDVKPANILITHSGEPMLSDFGIAKILEAEETVELTGTGVGVGTPEYMSPEQAQGKSVDARSDIYSLGVVFFEMVTGRKPYQADTPMAVVWKLASEPLPRPRQFVGDLPEAVEGVLLKALAKNPEDRYADMSAFAVVLEGLSSSHLKAGKAPRVQKTSVPKAPSRPGEKQGSRKWLPMVITIVLLVVVIAAGAGLFRMGQKGSGPLAFSQTMTPTNTRTPAITSTITPTPAIYENIPNPVGELLFSNTTIDFWDDFDANLSSLKWNKGDSRYSVENGLLYLRGYGNWAGISRNSSLIEGQGILILFKYDTPSAVFEIYLQESKALEYGWGHPEFKRWGIYGRGNEFSQDIWQGPNLVLVDWQQSDGFVPTYNHWYFVLLQVGGSREFQIRIWDAQDPMSYMATSRNMDAEWQDKYWSVGINVNASVLVIDYYQELTIVP